MKSGTEVLQQCPCSSIRALAATVAKRPIELGEQTMSPAARISRPDVDWKDQKLLANPYPWYADSRRDAPVHHVRMESGYEMWRCFRYDDMLEMLRSSNSQTMGVCLLRRATNSLKLLKT